MILQALNEYYNQLAQDKETDIPEYGFSVQKLHFAITIDRAGNLLQFSDIRETDGKKQLPKEVTVPAPPKRTVGISPNFMWDNTGYVFGAKTIDEKKTQKQQERGVERLQETFEAFKAFHHELGDRLDDDGMRAVLRFLDSWNPDNACKLNNWDEAAGKNILFRLDGDYEYIHQRAAIRECWKEHNSNKATGFTATCLVNGTKGAVAQLHPDIKGVRGAQSKGASLVSFNLDAFCSYNKEQSFNAPVSEEAAFAYSTALNYLLRTSTQRVQVGDATTVFWAEKKSKITEMFGQVIESNKEAGQVTELRNFFEAVQNGKMPYGIIPESRFYILGLSPNASRLSVRFWHVSTVYELSNRLKLHFSDLKIIKSYDNDPDFPGMWQLLVETATLHKSENISPVLTGAFMRSILIGAAYPHSLITAVIGRIRADRNVTYIRAALIKAYLCRKFRLNKEPMEVTMGLNKEETNIAYRLGRLFATLEKMQKDAIPGANATIKDRYAGSASATPRTVFPQLLRLAQHHIQKAEYGNANDKRIEEVMGGIDSFPAHLSLDEQGLFWLGYYHQKQDFYKKTDKKEEN